MQIWGSHSMRQASWMGLKLMSYNEKNRNELKTRLRTRKSPGFISVNPVFGFRFIVCFFPWGKELFLVLNCHFSVRKAFLISPLKEFSNVLPAAHKVAFVLCLNWEFPSEVIKWNKLKNKHLYLPQRRINRLQICFRGKAGKWTRLITIMDHLAP